MPFRPLRVLIVSEAGPLPLKLKARLAGDAGIDEIKTASGVSEAVRSLKTWSPDVVVARTVLPDGGARELVRELLAAGCPAPVVAVGPDRGDGEALLREGAADFALLPEHPEAKLFDVFCSEICVKVKIAAAPHSAPRGAARRPKPRRARCGVIAIGASTGGTDATAEIIRRLPDDLPGIVIVQHMPPGFTRMYAQRLDGLSGIRVTEAADGDRVKPGTALVAAGGVHLRLKRDAAGYFVRCVGTDRVNGHCPSVGVLFDSAAESAGPEAVGVILTGMGRDGAEGLLHMRRAGAYTIGQDRATSVVYGMPMAAYELGAVSVQAPLFKIADLILRRAEG